MDRPRFAPLRFAGLLGAALAAAISLAWPAASHGQFGVPGPPQSYSPPRSEQSGPSLSSPVAPRAPQGPPLQPPVAPGGQPSTNPPVNPDGTAPLVLDVRVDGIETISVERIRPHVKTRRGRPLDVATVQEDVRRLHSARMFANVRPVYQQVPGGVVLTFQVVERPSLKYVKYVGTKVKARHLTKQTGLKKGDSLDPYAVEDAREKLEQYYRDRGHTKVSVTVTEGTKPGDRGAVFVIHEGPIQKVEKITFIGNTIAPGGRLATQIDSKRPFLYIPGVFRGFKGFVDQDKVEGDVDKLTAYYRSLGFFQARVGREVEYDDDLKWASLSFVILEGQRFKVRNVQFFGNAKLTEEYLRGKLKLPGGKFFDQAAMDADINAIEDEYGGRGYIFSNIKPETRFLEEPGQVDLVYQISEGARCRVGAINVHINGEDTHTRRMAVLNRLSLRPGDIVDIRELRDSERRLKASGLFLTDPSKGNAPKIVFSAPDPQDAEEYAEKPDPPNRFRGQSPDPRVNGQPWRHTAARPAGPGWPGGEDEVLLDLTIVGALAPLDPTVAAPRAAANCPAAISAGAAGGMPTPPDVQGRRDAQSPAATPARQRRAAVPAIIRGQSPTPNGDLQWKAPPKGRNASSAPRDQERIGAEPRWARIAPSAAQSAPVAPRSTLARRPSVDEPTVIRAQGGVGYEAFEGDQMPSFDVAPAPQRPYAVGQAPLPANVPRAAPPAAVNAPPPVAAGAPVYPQPPAFQQAPNYQQPAYPQPAPAFQQGPAGGGYAPPGVPQYLPPGARPYPGPGAAPAPAYNPPPSSSGGSPFLGAPPTNAAPWNPPPAAPGSLPPTPPPGGYNAPGELFPDAIRPGIDPLQEPTIEVPLDVHVEETQTGRLMFGVGVNSNAGLVGNITLDEQNFDWRRVPRSWEDVRNATAFRGAGQHFRLEAMPGTVVQRYLASFTEPYLFDTRVSFGLSGSYFNRFYPNWTEERLGGRASFGYQLAPDLSTAVSFRAENVNISNPTVPTPPELTRVLGNSAIFSVRPQLTHDTRDSPFLPTQGHRLMFAFEEAFGSFTFPRFEVEGSQYFLLRQRADGSGRHTLSLISQFGITGTQTPVFENFFAGGFGTLRGFYFRGASPRDMNVTVGGRMQFLNTVEYLFPIKADDALRGVAFVDFGTVEPTLKIIGRDFRVSPGLGLRITIPAMGPAPIALDFAVPVLKAPGDRTQVFNFSVGVAR